MTFTAFYQDIPALSIWWLSPFHSPCHLFTRLVNLVAVTFHLFPTFSRLGRDIHGFLPRCPSLVNLVAVTFRLSTFRLCHLSPFHKMLAKEDAGIVPRGMLRLSESASFVFVAQDYRVGMMLLEQFIRHQVSLLRQRTNQIGIILNVRFLEFRIDLEQHKDDGVPHIGQSFPSPYMPSNTLPPLWLRRL